jgi:hypothetical protein
MEIHSKYGWPQLLTFKTNFYYSSSILRTGIVHRIEDAYYYYYYYYYYIV